MLIQRVRKTFSNVGADLFAIRRIKPDYLSVSVISVSVFYVLFALYILGLRFYIHYRISSYHICSLEELLDNHSSIESGRCLMIWGGWFEEA